MSDQDDGWKEVMDWAKQADTDRDPLSDAAFFKFNPDGTYRELVMWQECGRRADIKISVLQAELDGADKVIANLRNRVIELEDENSHITDQLDRSQDTTGELLQDNNHLRKLLIECAEYLERDKHVGMPRKIRAALEEGE